MRTDFTVDQVKEIEAKGCDLARSCRWDRAEIMAIAYHALIDANFPTEAAKLLEIADALHDE